jgi:hypothetical protein
MDLSAKDKIEILLTRYKEHAAHLRHLDNFDVRIFGGFITIQLVLASWFATHPIHELIAKLGITVVNFSLLVVAFSIIKSSRNRRDEIVQVIWNINEAFELDKKGVYLADNLTESESRRRRTIRLR